MAKRKNPQANPQKADIDLELLTHKYSRIYIDNESEIRREGEEDTNYMWYDTKRVYYPYYKTQVKYRVAKVLELHPIILEILHIINELEKLQERNNLATLKEITQLDSEIFHSIMSDLEIKGYVEIENGILKLSKNGKELLKKKKERVIESSSSYVCIDGIFGNVCGVAQYSRGIMLEDRADKDAIELKPNSQKRPRIEELHKEFKENLSLEQVLREGLNGADDKWVENESKVEKDSLNTESKEMKSTREEYDIVSIDEIKPQKFFKSYVCLFYKSADNGEKILVIDEKYEIDRNATKLFENLIDTGSFNANENKAFKENIKKFKNLSGEKIEQEIKLEIDIAEGKTLETSEHKSYILYVLRNAKNAIYIHSPWVRYNVLQEYEKDIESALKRNIKVTIKYGLKPRNKHDKKPIDTESTKLFDKWSKEYPNFEAIPDDNHSKILVFDSEFMIVGSFNWLSFGGTADRDGDVRGEASVVVENKDSIRKEIEKFKK